MINIDAMKSELTALEAHSGTLSEKEKVRLLRLKTELSYYKAVAVAEFSRVLANPANKSQATKYIEKRKKSLEKSVKKLVDKQVGAKPNSFFYKRRDKKIEARKKELANLKDFAINGKGFSEYLMAMQGADKSKVLNQLANSTELVKDTGNGMCLFLGKDADGNTVVNESNIKLTLAYISGNPDSYNKLVATDKKEKEILKVDDLVREVPERVDRFVNKLEERNKLAAKHVGITSKLGKINGNLSRHPILRNVMFISKMRAKNLNNKQAECERDIHGFDMGIKDDYNELARANAVSTLPLELADSVNGVKDYFKVVGLGSDIVKSKQKIVDDSRVGYANLRVSLENDKKAILATVPLEHRTADFRCLDRIASPQVPKSANQLSEAKESLESLLRINEANDPKNVRKCINKLLSANNQKEAKTNLKEDVINYSRR